MIKKIKKLLKFRKAKNTYLLFLLSRLQWFVGSGCLLDPEFEITDDLHCSVINFAMYILKKEIKGKLNFGVRKQETLHRVPQSISETFPR